MTRNFARAVVASLLLAFLGGSGCDGEPTEPKQATVIHAAHAAPTEGRQNVVFNGTTVAEGMSVGGSIVDTLEAGPQVVTFDGPDRNRTASDVTFDEDYGVVLLTGGRLLAFENSGTRDSASIVLIGGIPDSPPSVRFDRAGSSFAVDLFFTAPFSTRLAPGTWEVFVAPADDPTEFVAVGEVELPAGRHFVVIYPTPTESEPYSVLIF